MQEWVVAQAVIVIGMVISTIVQLFNLYFKYRIGKEHKNVVERQLVNVFAPIHSIINDNNKSKKEAKREVEKIIKEQYHLIDPRLVEFFEGGLNKKFCRLVDSCYKILRFELRYSWVKYNDIDDEAEGMVAQMPRIEKFLRVFECIVGTLVVILLVCYFIRFVFQ